MILTTQHYYLLSEISYYINPLATIFFEVKSSDLKPDDLLQCLQKWFKNRIS